MKTKLTTVQCFCLLLLFTAISPVTAQTSDQEIKALIFRLSDPYIVYNASIDNQSPSEAQLRIGQAIVETGKGQSSQVAACVSCHSSSLLESAPYMPRITGLSALYLYKQLQGYQQGLRKNPMMAPMVAALSDEDMKAVAMYYATQPITVQSTKTKTLTATAQRIISRGEEIANEGIPLANIPACVNCHGIAGHGIPPSVPGIAGQKASYMETQFKAWKDHSRSNDPLTIMQVIAGSISRSDLKAVSRYYESLN